ncbi:MAG: UDP-glucose 4-epimerase GalE [Acidiferrobacterales bacterium]
MSRAVLVTGGAGYIGSHTCRHLIDAGNAVVVVDNFYSGHRWAVPEQATLIEGDVGDPGLMDQTLRQHEIDAVIHFAGHIVVPESVRDPLKYYRNNTIASYHLVRACVDAGVSKFIYSSTAAVYGIPASLPVNEDASTVPINPYGASKLMTEWMLRDIASSCHGDELPAVVNRDFRYVALRYFNVAGARLDGTLGQATPDATHLIKVACEAACGLRNGVTIFGTDYPTPDGTCIRDYIHVDDLAVAHLAALQYLGDGGASVALNCGYGTGFSVREVLDTVKEVSNSDFKISEGPPRDGDPSNLIADARRIREILRWEPKLQDIEVICRSAYNWEKQYQNKAR